MSDNHVKQVSWALIIIASFLELGGISFYRSYFGIYNSPLLLLTSGLIVGLTFLFLCKNKRVEIPQSNSIVNQWAVGFDFALIGIGLFFCWTKLYDWIELYPHTIFSEGKGSDVIPLIRVMGNNRCPYFQSSPVII